MRYRNTLPSVISLAFSMLILIACGTTQFEATPSSPASTPVVPLTDTPIPPSNTPVPIDPTPVGLWQDSLSVEYTPEKDPTYSFVDQTGEKAILRIPAGNTSIHARFSAVDNDIVSARVTNSSGTVDITVSDFEVEPLDSVPPGYSEETPLSRFTTKAVSIPVAFGDVLTVTFSGKDGSSGTTTYEMHPSIQDSIEASIQALGTHGAVISLEPNPAYAHLLDWQTYLQDRSVSVSIGQEGRLLQEKVPIEVIEGVTFAELVDFKYKLNVPIDFEVNVTRNGVTYTENRTLEGLATYPSFIPPLIRQSDVAKFGSGLPLEIIKAHGGEIEPGETKPVPIYYAVDIIGNPGDREITGLPVYMPPGDYQVIQVWGTDDGPLDQNLEVYLLHLDTGAMFSLIHVRPGEALVQLIADYHGVDSNDPDFDINDYLDGFGSRYPGDERYKGSDGFILTLSDDAPVVVVGYSNNIENTEKDEPDVTDFEASRAHETQLDHLHIGAQVPTLEDKLPGEDIFWQPAAGWYFGPSSFYGGCPDGRGPCLDLGKPSLHIPGYLTEGEGYEGWVNQGL